MKEVRKLEETDSMRGTQGYSVKHTSLKTNRLRGALTVECIGRVKKETGLEELE